MTTDSLIEALEREHHEIDRDLDRFLTDTHGGGRDSAPLLQAITALRRHIYLEEEYLFPALPDPALAAPVFVMLREHAQIWQLLDSLEREVRAHDGDGAATTHLCRQLAVQLQHHNQKEERIIYPAAANTIPPEVTDRIDQHSRSTPEAPLDWSASKHGTEEGRTSNV